MVNGSTSTAAGRCAQLAHTRTCTGTNNALCIFQQQKWQQMLIHLSSSPSICLWSSDYKVYFTVPHIKYGPRKGLNSWQVPMQLDVHVHVVYRLIHCGVCVCVCVCVSECVCVCVRVCVCVCVCVCV